MLGWRRTNDLPKEYWSGIIKVYNSGEFIHKLAVSAFDFDFCSAIGNVS